MSNDKELNEAAKRNVSEWKEHGEYTEAFIDGLEIGFHDGSKYQAPLSEAIGEARGWRDAIDWMMESRGPEKMKPRQLIADDLKQEAKRRGILK